MKHTESIASLAVSLAKVHTELKAVAKDAENPFYKNSYASLDVLTEYVRPILAKNGLSLVQGAATPHTDSEGTLRNLTIETMLVHASGEWLTSSVTLPVSNDPTAQSAGATITYGRRYGLAALLCLTTEEDDDGNKASEKGASRPQAAKATQKVAGSSTTPKADADKLMPFGKTKGQKLGDLGDKELDSTLSWCKATDAEKFKDLIGAIERVLDSRAPVGAGEDFPDALREGPDDLPF